MEQNLFAMDVQKITKLPPLPAKRCEACGSVFLTDLECESCGKQFQKDLIGIPGGEKSFYALKERYIEDVGAFLYRFDSFLAKDAGFRVRYLALMKKRFLHLLNMFDDQHANFQRAQAFLVEFEDLIAEMARLGVKRSYFYDMLSLVEKSPLYYKLNSLFNEQLGHTQSVLWKRKVFGTIRLHVLVMTLAAYSFVCAAAIWMFSYLANR